MIQICILEMSLWPQQGITVLAEIEGHRLGDA